MSVNKITFSDSDDELGVTINRGNAKQFIANCDRMLAKGKERKKRERERLVACAHRTVDEMKDGSPTMEALAKVGINALIDEATGYQDERPKDDLRKQMKKARKRVK